MELTLRDYVINELIRIEIESNMCDHKYMAECLRSGFSHPGYDNMTDEEILKEYEGVVDESDELLIKFKTEVYADKIILNNHCTQCDEVISNTETTCDDWNCVSKEENE